MEAKVVNLNSAFDSWRDDIETMLLQLEAPRIAQALGIPDAESAIRDRLNGLRWIFLVSDGTLRAQVRSNPHGEDRERENLRRDFPFRQRRGGNQGESQFYRQPRTAAGGGVVEALGIYSRDLRAFARKAPLKESFPRSREDRTEDILECLETLLPDGAEGPAVFLCPELLFKLPHELVQALEVEEPHPAARLNVSELFLRMTLSHEIGHHVLPASERLHRGEYAYTSVSEALANTFCDALLDSTERQWLFAKAHLLQPSVYLGYFVPRVLEKFYPSGQIAKEWRNVIRHCLGLTSNGHDPRRFEYLDLFHHKAFFEHMAFVGSPQMYLAMSGLLEGLLMYPEAAEAFMMGFEPCALAPFDEFDMVWATEAGLLRLLQDREPSVQAEAFHALTRMDARKPETNHELARWCDANLTSENLQKATRAWNSWFAHREEERLVRYRRVAMSGHETIVADLPVQARRHCSKEDARSVIGNLITDSRSDVHQAAVREFAAILYEVGDVAALQSFILAASYEELLEVWNNPQRARMKWSPAFLHKLATRDVSGLQHGGDTNTKERVAREAHEVLVGKVAELVSDERAVLGDHSDVAALLRYVAEHSDMDVLLPKLTARVRALTKEDQRKVAEDLLFGKAKGPLALRLAIVRMLKTSSIYNDVAVRLLKDEHADDQDYQVATEVLEDNLRDGRFSFEIAATAATGIRETDGPGYAVRKRAAQAIVAEWTRSPGPSPERQAASFQELLKRGYVVAVLDVILPALLPGWSASQMGSVLMDMVQHRNALVRRSAAHHLHQQGMIDAELQRRLLLDTSFLVMEQTWQDQGGGVIPIDLLIEAARGSLPSFRDREGDRKERAKIKKDALECLLRKLPSLAGEELASVKAVLRDAEIAQEGEPKTVDALVNALSEKDAKARIVAAERLGLRESNPKVITALVDALAKEENWIVRGSIAETLGKLGNADPQVIQTLLDAYKKDAHSSVRREPYEIALKRLGAAAPRQD